MVAALPPGERAAALLYYRQEMSVHEIARGKFDFGKSDPKKDLDAAETSYKAIEAQWISAKARARAAATCISTNTSPPSRS